jgi:hypothetical protein
LYVNYKLGIITMWNLPKLSQVPYPFFMDLNKITNRFLK